jgi:hypothetical protein
MVLHHSGMLKNAQNLVKPWISYDLLFCGGRARVSIKILSKLWLGLVVFCMFIAFCFFVFYNFCSFLYIHIYIYIYIYSVAVVSTKVFDSDSFEGAHIPPHSYRHGPGV